MDQALRNAIIARSRLRCECGCGRPAVHGEFDHFFGRAKAEETIATVWLLRVDCHYAKTRNHPHNADWQRRFIEHCRRHGYAESQRRAEARLHFVETRGAFGTALGAIR